MNADVISSMRLVFELMVKLPCPPSVYYSVQKARVLCKLQDINLCNKKHKSSLFALSNNQKFLIQYAMNKHLAQCSLVHQTQPEHQIGASPGYLEKRKQ